MPSFFIRTYGCQMNERDSEALASLLKSQGYIPVDHEEDADAVIFNTCSVRDQAEQKVFGKVGLLKRLKRRRPDLVIAVVGCMAQVYGEELIEKLPHIDLVVGTDQLPDVPGMLESIFLTRQKRVATERRKDATGLIGGHRPGRVTASVAVMRGCNQFCSYCIVPYARGPEKSRSIDSILAEVRSMVEKGAREVLLLGQNITAYGLAEAGRSAAKSTTASPFADLLRAVHDLEGIQRIRFTSPHVAFMNEAFIDAICTLPKVCKAFHIPAQSGSDKILKRMRRGYTAREFLQRVETIRKRVPEACFSTDLIVGFPGETEMDFLATRQLLEDMDADMAYIFRYSPRQGTKAADAYVDDVPDNIKHERNQILLADLETGVRRRNAAFINHRLDILCEGPSKRNPARWQGRSDGNKVVIFDPPEEIRPGDMVNVTIVRVTSHSLFGTVSDA